MTCQDPGAWEVSSVAPKRRDTDLLTPSDGVLVPDELLTSSIGGWALDLRSRVPRRPEPPGAETSEIGYVLAAWTARTAGRRPRIRSIAIATMNPTRTTEKASWRIGACMPVRRREPGLCFVDRVVLDGNLVRVGGRTRAGHDRTDVL